MGAVFLSIELGILGQRLEVRPGQTQTVVHHEQVHRESKKDKKKRNSIKEPQALIQPVDDTASPIVALYNRLRQSPTHGSDIIKESAEHLLLLLTHFVQNFPGPKGIDVFFFSNQ